MECWRLLMTGWQRAWAQRVPSGFVYRFFTDFTAHEGALDPRIGGIGCYQAVSADRERDLGRARATGDSTGELRFYLRRQSAGGCSDGRCEQVGHGEWGTGQGAGMSEAADRADAGGDSQAEAPGRGSEGLAAGVAVVWMAEGRTSFLLVLCYRRGRRRR